MSKYTLIGLLSLVGLYQSRTGAYRMNERIPLQGVLSKIPVRSEDNVRTRIMFHGRSINPMSRRMQTFKTKGTTCAHCGLEATHWELVADKYGVDWKLILMSNDVEMTQDHIIPKSRGGTNKMDNAQTLCMPCNFAKGGKLEEELNL